MKNPGVLMVLIIGICSQVTVHVGGHGRFLKPPSRSSMWRLAQYQKYNPPVNYNDNQLYCGGVPQKENPGRNCGVCGDPLSEPRPRPNEIGGKFYKGFIVAQYTAGELMLVEAEITAPHMGYMEWRLCTDPLREDQDCFDENVLEVADGTGSRLDVGTEAGIFWAKLRVPANVSCDHCVVQWNYRAGNNWGFCKNGEGRLGCGPQETFRGCSDVRIVSSTAQFDSNDI